MTLTGASAPSVLHLAAPAPYGGLESVSLAMARGQQTAGQRVAVGALVDPSPHPHPWVGVLEGAGIPVHAVHVSGRGYLAERRVVRRLLEEVRPDVFHTHEYHRRRRGLAGGLAHRHPHWEHRSRLHRDQSTQQTQRLGPALLVPALAGSRGRLRPQPGRPRGVPVVGWVERLSPEDGPDVMIDALDATGDAGPLLSFVGSGRMEAELRARASERGLDGRILWHGMVPDAGGCLTGFDAVLLTS